MVNYKRAVCEGLVVLALVGLVTAAPLPADCSDKQHHYDQRQNGSENYRLNIDGVVIAVAPADSLLAAASDIDFGDLLDLSDLNDLPSKPPAIKPPADLKPQESKPPADSSVSASESKPDAAKPEAPLSDVSLPSDEKEQKKEVKSRKQEKAQRYLCYFISYIHYLDNVFQRGRQRKLFSNCYDPTNLFRLFNFLFVGKYSLL